MSWTFNSTNLDQAGKYTTQEISGVDLPPVRQDNIIVPLREGRMHARKYFDQRTVTIGIVIQGTSQSDAEANVDALLALFGVRTQQLLIHVNAATVTTQNYAEVIQPVNLTWVSSTVARMAVNFVMSDPLFRSPNIYELEVTVDSTAHAVDVVNAGAAEEHKSIILLTGPLEHAKLEHIALGVWVQYDAHLANADTVTIDCYNYTAVHSVSGNVINSIKHSGDPKFMYFLPGTNHCHLTHANAGDTTGKVKVSFYPGYFD
jgi:hypothetical protein